ncbi:MAG: ParB/RepB/Spo0J family partition protein, partial [Clostridia bacterium]|nr:ParB/RepB/Spo0J family partition protein [Clostridia bacterium]
MIIQKIEMSKLYPYEGNPFRVTDDDQMEMMVDSIKAKGIIEPLIVRPDGSGEYEIISGHRRFHACKKLGLKMIPCYVSEMSREDAVVVLVDSNLYRDGLLPSEKAFAYKMKYDVLKHQGQRTDLTFGQVDQKLPGSSAVQMARDLNESEKTVRR